MPVKLSMLSVTKPSKLSKKQYAARSMTNLPALSVQAQQSLPGWR